MAVLLYQIGIFIVIQVSAMFGKNSRNTAIVLVTIFTILQVFMSWLLILQFFTIIISYIISNNLFFNEKDTTKESTNSEDFDIRKNNTPNLDSKIRRKGALDVEYVSDEKDRAINEMRKEAINYFDRINEKEINSSDRQKKLLTMYRKQIDDKTNSDKEES